MYHSQPDRLNLKHFFFHRKKELRTIVLILPTRSCIISYTTTYHDRLEEE